MRRKDHPSFPRAITCCFFSSLKTLLMPREPIKAPLGVNVPDFPMAGFQVTLYGRFWVTAEDVHLFEEVPTRSGYLRYKGQMICTVYQLVDAPDTDQNIRRAILFELAPIEGFESETDEVPLNTEGPNVLESLRSKALADSAACRTPVERRALWRMRSRAI